MPDNGISVEKLTWMHFLMDEEWEVVNANQMGKCALAQLRSLKTQMLLTPASPP
jgi:hypothetical protein